jgi:hypothetical protein
MEFVVEGAFSSRKDPFGINAIENASFTVGLRWR